MKRLVVMRHAKAQADAGEGDHARPLSDRGRRDAARVGQRLQELGWCPDVVVCSSSARTRETWDRLSTVLPTPRDAWFDRRLYLCSPDDVTDVLFDLGEKSDGTVLVLGHNPGWEQLVARLSGVDVEMPTSAAALLIHAEDKPWPASFVAGTWRMFDLLRP